MQKLLPIGRSTFDALQARNEIYVDKTAQIYDLARYDAKIFLARPRRFGKSLLISTFESLFRHGLASFKGLKIENLWNDKTYPVVLLDFSGLKVYENREQFASAFFSLLQSSFMQVGFNYQPALKTVSFIDQLKMWFASLENTSLVLLIDEYDTPLTAHLDEPAAFEAIRDCLGEFYAAIKQYEGCFRFFFMTGITKFSNTSIFSAFNNLQDISQDSLYGSLIGYTHEEIQTYFEFYLTRAAQTLHLSREEVLAELKAHYDGFSFDEKAQHRVYCPWSVLNFLNRPDRGFQNYWYSSGGQPTVLMKYLINHALSEPISYSEVREIRLSELNAARQYDDIGLEVLLTQAGYYTIRAVSEDGYAVLSYPNQEVAVSMAQLYADKLLRRRRIRAEGHVPIKEAMINADVEAVVRYFDAAVSAIDYVRYPITDEQSCRAYIQVLLIGAAMLPKVEVHNALGRSDLEVEIGDRHWVFEFKYARQESDAEEILDEAVRQIETRRYGNVQPGKDLIRVAVVFDGQRRCFCGWRRV